MSLFTKLSIIVVSMIFILHIMGIETGADSILIKFGLDNNGTISLSTFFLGLLVIYAAAVTAGIAVGFLTGAPTEYIVLATSLAGLAILAGAFDSMISSAGGYSSWVGTPLAIFIAILGLTYIYSTLDFVFNR